MTTKGKEPAGNLVAADFEQDGKDDLGYTWAGGGGGSLLMGRGDGTFVAGPDTWAFTGSWSTAFAAARDFDHDGRTDLVVTFFGSDSGTSNASSFLLSRGNGKGMFDAVTDGPPSAGTDSIGIGDWQHDGNQGIVVHSYHIGQAQSFVGLGDGTFGQPVDIQGGMAGTCQVPVADFDEDGNLDFLGSGGVWLGDGHGKFHLLGGLPADFAFECPAAASDLNNDGHVDVIGTNQALDGDLRIFLNDGRGRFVSAGHYVLARAPTGIAVTDLDGDGNLDVAVSGLPGLRGEPSGLWILLGDGKGNFPTVTKQVDGMADSVVSSDFNCDGMPDLAIGAGDRGVIVLLNTSQ